MPDYSSYQRGVINRYYQHLDTIIVTRLAELVSDLAVAPAPSQRKKLWVRVRQMLLRIDPKNEYFHQILRNEDAEELARLVTLLTGGQEPPKEADPAKSRAPAAQEPAPKPARDPAAAPTEQDLKMALKAFKKRLRLARLNDESRLGRGRKLTAGRPSEIDAIIPPHEFPAAVWNELVSRGRLKYTGGGFYQLVE